MAENENPTPTKSGGIGMLLLPIAIVVNFGVLGVGSYFVFANTIGFEAPKITEEVEVVTLASQLDEMESDIILYRMDEFTLNLSGHPRRAIRFEIALEMLDEKGFEEVVQVGAVARDSIVKILNAKRFQDIETIQGKLFLKDQIAASLNGFLKEGVVKDVLFTDFVVQ
ncbi:MAG: flagellar basal body-associated FliL family protein [Pseudomonadota bacterium]|nr:flagellar basal body-associated FliL family protein [Pseudomonadota bacterium]